MCTLVNLKTTKITWASTTLQWTCPWLAYRILPVLTWFWLKGRSIVNFRRSSLDNKTTIKLIIRSSIFKIYHTKYWINRIRRLRYLENLRVWVLRRMLRPEHRLLWMNMYRRSHNMKEYLWIRDTRQKIQKIISSLKYPIEYSKRRLMTRAHWNRIAFHPRSLGGEIKIIWVLSNRRSLNWCLQTKIKLKWSRCRIWI